MAGRERVHGFIVVAAGGMVVALTESAGEGIAGGAIAPWLVVVERQALFAVRSLGIVDTLTHRVYLSTTSSRMTITRTPGVTMNLD